MNKLIKKIIDENLYASWKDDVQDYTVSSASLEELEDLVKAVVRECIDSVLDCSVEYATRPQIAQELKEHFGVE